MQNNKIFHTGLERTPLDELTIFSNILFKEADPRR
jgi:hypothetical protein